MKFRVALSDGVKIIAPLSLDDTMKQVEDNSRPSFSRALMKCCMKYHP